MPDPLTIIGGLVAGYLALNSGPKVSAELREQHDELKKLHAALPDGMRHAGRSLRYFKKRVKDERGKPFVKLFERLFKEEFEKKPLVKVTAGEAEFKRFRKWMEQYRDKVESSERTLPIFADTIYEMYRQAVDSLPDVPKTKDPHAISVPLIETIGGLGKAVEQILQPVFHPGAVSAGLFSGMRDKVKYVQDVHGRPAKFEGRPHALMATYMKPFDLDGIFIGTASISIPEKTWLSHCVLLAQTRLGKTNVIRWRMNQLLPLVAEGRASVVLMEPKGVLTEEVLHLESVGRMLDRVVILDPIDTRVSVNIFDKGNGSDYAIEQTIARVKRVINTVTTGLTPFQTDALTYALRAMFYVDQPGSIRLLTRILRSGLQGLEIRNLPYVVQEYFASFKAGDASAMQVVNRLNGLVADPVFEALFDSTHSTFNMFDELQPGKLIVINAKAADSLYARFWIEQVASCIAPRLDLPLAVRTPTTFIIDEAQDFISEDLHFAKILDKAAEAKIGMLIGMHHMSQIKDVAVRGSIFTNCAMKFAAKTSEDIYTLCRALGMTTPDFINSLARYEFAHISPDLERPIRIKTPLVEFEKMPKMKDDVYRRMRADDRKKYHYVRPAQPILAESPSAIMETKPTPPTRAKPAPKAAPKSPPRDESEDDGSNFRL